MKKLDFQALKTIRTLVLSLLLSAVAHRSADAQTIMFDDFTYSDVNDLTNSGNQAFNKWTVVNGRSGPPEGAQYDRNNVTFTADPSNSANKFLNLKTTVNGATRATTHSRIETGGFEYFTGTYASRVYLSDEAFGTKDANIQTFFTIVSSSLAQDGTKYSELDIVEYMAADKWGVSPDKQVMYTTSYHKYIADPWKPWKTYFASTRSLQGWHTFIASCTDGVNVKYWMDNEYLGAQSVTDNETQAGLPVYPRSNMQVAFANWIWNNVLGSSTANRTNTMQADWVLYFKDQAKTLTEINAQVNTFRSAGIQRRNLLGATYSTGTTNQFPTVGLTAPANNATYNAPATINLAANAADADGSVTQVQFFNGTNALGTDNAAPYTFSWTNVAAGTYTITAKATDNSGAVTTSSPITVIVNQAINQAPTVSISAPGNNTVFNAPASINITANATDADGTVSQVQFFNGAASLGTDNTAPYTFSWTNVAAGTYTITAKATDNSGAVTTSSAITVVVNPIPVAQSPYGGVAQTIPGIIQAEKYDLGGQGIAYNETTTANQGGAYRTSEAVDVEANTTGFNVGYIIADEWLEYTVNVTAGTYKIDAKVAAIAAGKTFRLELDGATIANFTVPNTGAWNVFQLSTVNNVTVTAGQKILRIYATSSDFNIDDITFSSIVVTNQPPTVSITAPANNATFTAPAGINITANAADADGTVSQVQFFNGAVSIGTDNVAPYSFSWTNVAAGTYTITAKATDNSGAVTTSSAVTIVVNPVASTQSPYGGVAQTIPGTIQAEKYDLGGQGIAFNDNTAANEGGAFRTTEAVDVEANTTGFNVGYIWADEWLEYTVNVTAGTYKVEAKVAAIAAGKTFRLELDGATIANFTVPNTGAWNVFQLATVNNVTVTSGQKILRIYATSTDFNVDDITFSSATATNQVPTVSITAPANGATYTAPATINITATAADADGTVSQVQFFNGANLLGTDNTVPYSFNWTNVAAGTYTITAKATDNSGAVTTSSAATVTVNAVSNSCYNLVWADEFDQPTLNTSNWNVEVNNNGGGNNELQYYTNRTENVRIENGNLVIEARKENYQGSAYTSGRLNSSGKKSWKYGKIEAKLKLPYGNGMWPAFWMMGNTGNWPACGEIDIMELVGGNKCGSECGDNKTHGYAWWSDNGDKSDGKQAPTLASGKYADDYHVFGVEWDATSIKWTIDGNVFNTISTSSAAMSEFQQPFYLLLNVAVGGDWPGSPDATTVFPQKMYVEYVRVYQKTGSACTEVNPTNTCASIANYQESAGYIAGSKVKNADKQYECKPAPYSGWCNGASWAYAPGTGAYWSDAWNLIGSCTSSGRSADKATIDETLLTNAPNPFSGTTTVELVTPEAGEASVKVYNKTGQLIQTLAEGYFATGTHYFVFDASGLQADIYLIKCNTANGVITRKVVKTE